jgi:hypothetical protein
MQRRCNLPHNNDGIGGALAVNAPDRRHLRTGVKRSAHAGKGGSHRGDVARMLPFDGWTVAAYTPPRW